MGGGGGGTLSALFWYLCQTLSLFYTLIKLYYTKALSNQALSLAPDWIPLLWRPRIPVFHGSATTLSSYYSQFGTYHFLYYIQINHKQYSIWYCYCIWLNICHKLTSFPYHYMCEIILGWNIQSKFSHSHFYMVIPLCYYTMIVNMFSYW